MFSLPLVLETFPRVLKLPSPTENLEKFGPLGFRLCGSDFSFSPSVWTSLFRSLVGAVRVPSVVGVISGSEDEELSESESELEPDCQVAVFRAVGTWTVCPLLNPYRDCCGAGTGLSVGFFRVRSVVRGIDVGAWYKDSTGRVLIIPEGAPPPEEGVRAVDEA